MIRIMLVDDHAALRAGLETVLAREPDLVPVAATEGNEELWPNFHRTRPDLLLLDYHLPGQSSLAICRRLKAIVPTPRVAFYSAYANASLTVPLRLAGADGLASKGAPAADLVAFVRRVAGGEKVLPPLTPDVQRAALDPLGPDERVICGMLLAGASVADVAEIMRVDAEASAARIDRLMRRFAASATSSPAARH